MFDIYTDIVVNGITIKNITERYLITTPKRSNILQDYLIVDWESPEIVSYKVYGTLDYEWAVLLSNNVVNPFTDWLMKEDEIIQYIEETYGNAMHEIHHYEYGDLIYDKSFHPLLATPVTNYEYLYDRNEKKRKIQVVIPELIEDVEALLLTMI